MRLKLEVIQNLGPNLFVTIKSGLRILTQGEVGEDDLIKAKPDELSNLINDVFV